MGTKRKVVNKGNTEEIKVSIIQGMIEDGAIIDLFAERENKELFLNLAIQATFDLDERNGSYMETLGPIMGEQKSRTWSYLGLPMQYLKTGSPVYFKVKEVLNEQKNDSDAYHQWCNMGNKKSISHHITVVDGSSVVPNQSP